MEARVGKHQAVNVEVTDTGNFFSGSDVETILQEIKLTASDDGTYILVSVGAVKLFKIRKADGQLLIGGGLDADQTL